MTDPQQKLSPSEVADAALDGWTHDGDTLYAHFPTGDFATGLRLVNLIGASAEEANHHPDLTLTYPEARVLLTSHDVGGVTSRDVDLARIITGHARTVGVL